MDRKVINSSSVGDLNGSSAGKHYIIPRSFSLSSIEKGYAAVKSAIATAAKVSGRDPQSVRLIAVSKTVGIEEVRLAYNLGIHDFGENRVQDAAEKVKDLPEAKWHFIGHLQSNKVKDVLPFYSLIHSLDRKSLANALQNYAEKMGMTVDVLLQVNVSGEKSKYGLAPDELPSFLDYLCDLKKIRLCGLMTMAPYVEDAEEARPYFRQLRQLRDHYSFSCPDLKELSMGMTNDYKVAVEEGATIVRIGTAIFG
jgi:PLP dependent protein